MEDEWDALCLESIAAKIQKGVLPVSGGVSSSLFIKSILEQKKEIIIWPGQLIAKYPEIFESLDDEKITTVSSSIPRPKLHRSTLTLLNVLIRDLRRSNITQIKYGYPRFNFAWNHSFGDDMI